MTREEAIRILKTLEINSRPVNNTFEACEEVQNRFNALIMAIKALEQESCGDAISRADVRHLIAEIKRKSLYSISSKAFEKLYNGIDDLPPVNPQEPLTEEDYIELCDRFGEWVEFVVRDMISGKGERWTKNNPQEQKYCDRNICISNEYNGIGCNECEVTGK